MKGGDDDSSLANPKSAIFIMLFVTNKFSAVCKKQIKNLILLVQQRYIFRRTLLGNLYQVSDPDEHIHVYAHEQDLEAIEPLSL